MAKILVIDDSKTIREVTKETLEEAGHSVIMAEDGNLGLEMARKENPDLIILDVMLPKLDGYQICRMLKFDEKYKHIPIIMFTSRSAEEDKKIGQDVKADDYVTKDFDQKQLVDIVNKHLPGAK